MDLKGFATDHWYRALTFLAGAGFIGAASVGNDPALRKAMLLLCVGGVLFGFGQWIDHPYQERVDPYGQFKISSRNYRPSIAGSVPQLIGAALVARALWLLW